MKEYIEREKAFDAVFGQFCASSDETEAALNAAIEEIRAIPAADVRPVVNTCETCGYKTEQIKVKPYDGACCYWKLHSIKNEEWCCHWKQREES